MRSWSRTRIDRMVAYYSVEGTSVQAVAKAMRTNKKIVRKYLQLRGIRIRPHSEVTPRGERHHEWKGGRTVDKSGYVLLRAPDHPHKNNAGYVREHRLVMERHIGRYLTPDEVVHHKNRVHDDNRIENLQLYSSNGAHLSEELKGHCPKWTAEGRKKILAAHRRWCVEEYKKNHPIRGVRRLLLSSFQSGKTHHTSAQD